MKVTPAQVMEKHIRHLRTYDPVKAHEYYLRTRKLKGRKRGGSDTETPRLSKSPEIEVVKTGGTPKQSRSPVQIRTEAAARQKALEGRLATLRAELQKLVAQAKDRSGVDEPDKATDSKKESDSSSKEPDKPSKLTKAELAEKAKKAREDYQKEKKTSTDSSSEDSEPASVEERIARVRAQISRIQAQLKAAIEEARNSPPRTSLPVSGWNPGTNPQTAKGR